jgi:hypothetical protein
MTPPRNGFVKEFSLTGLTVAEDKVDEWFAAGTAPLGGTDGFSVEGLKTLPQASSGLPSLLRTHIKVGRRKQTLYQYLSNDHAAILPDAAKAVILGKMKQIGFRPNTAKHFCALPAAELLRVDGIWLAVQDAFFTGVPEFFALHAEEVIRLYVWVISNAVYGTDQFMARYKRFMNSLRYAASTSTEMIATCGDLWHGPKGWNCPIPFLQRLMTGGGIMGKAEATRLAMLVSTRGLPAAGRFTEVKSVRKHYVNLTQTTEISDERYAYLYGLATRIGRKIRRTSYEGVALRDDPGHVSISTSATFAVSRKEGGKSWDVSTSFSHWVQKVPIEDRTWYLPTGHAIEERAGIAKWRTIRCPGFPEPEEPVWATWLEEYSLWDSPLPTHAGLNAHTGLMFLACAFETAEFLSGEDFSPSTDRLPFVRVAGVSEPGNKFRIITAGEWQYSVILQPYAHWMLAELKNHPPCQQGLGGALQGFEWVKAAGKKPFGSDADCWLLSSDLSEATDHCSHKVAAAAMRGLLEGLGIRNNYFDLAVSLQTCGRIAYYEGYTDIVPAFAETTRGVLMGDPGTKVVLTMFNLLAEEEAIDRYFSGDIPRRIPWRHFACAGDDHLAVGPKPYLEMITSSHRMNLMEVNESQNFISKTLAKYCEEFIYMDNEVRPLGVNMFRVSYNEHSHVDAFKVRLLSRAVKGADARLDKNPAIGKGSQLAKYGQWAPPGFEQTFRSVIPWYFHRRMFTLLEGSSVLRFLPCAAGGLGHGCGDFTMEQWCEVLKECSPMHIRALIRLSKRDFDPHMTNALRALSSSKWRRGVDLSFPEELFRCLGLLAEARGVNLWKIDDILLMEDIDISRMRYVDKVKLVQKKGYRSMKRLVQDYLRPKMFEELFTTPEPKKEFRTIPLPLKRQQMDEQLKSHGLSESEISPFEILSAVEFLMEHGTDTQMGRWMSDDDFVHMEEFDRNLGQISQIENEPGFHKAVLVGLDHPSTGETYWYIVPKGKIAPKTAYRGGGPMPDLPFEELKFFTKNIEVYTLIRATMYGIAYDPDSPERTSVSTGPLQKALASAPELRVPLASWVLRS